MPGKRVWCIVLASILAISVIAVPLLSAYLPQNQGVTADKNDGMPVSDYFFIQMYDEEKQVISKYQVTLTGIVSIEDSRITSVSFSHISGDVCDVTHDISGNTVVVTMTHHKEGALERNFILSSDGTFSGY